MEKSFEEALTELMDEYAATENDELISALELQLYNLKEAENSADIEVE